MISQKERRAIASKYGAISRIYSEEQKESIGFCPEGYAFVNILTDERDYRVYRCDGGHHIGIMLKKPPHEKHSPRSIVLTKDGKVSMSGTAEAPTDVPVW